MNLTVLSIVGGVNEQNDIVNSFRCTRLYKDQSLEVIEYNVNPRPLFVSSKLLCSLSSNFRKLAMLTLLASQAILC